MIRTQIVDPRTGKSARVDEEHALQVTERFTPPFGVPDIIRPLRRFFTGDGLTTGSSDMLVDGSVTPVEFWIPASPTEDRYINSVSIVIADQGSTLNKFGNITPLPVGLDFFYESDAGDITIADALVSNFEFVRLAQGQPSFGTANDAFLAGNAIGPTGNPSEAYMPVINLAQVFGTKFGIRLKAGSLQRIVFRVNDDVSVIDRFDIQGFGFDRLDTRDPAEDTLGNID